MGPTRPDTAEADRSGGWTARSGAGRVPPQVAQATEGGIKASNQAPAIADLAAEATAADRRGEPPADVARKRGDSDQDRRGRQGPAPSRGRAACGSKSGSWRKPPRSPASAKRVGGDEFFLPERTELRPLGNKIRLAFLIDQITRQT